MKAEIVSVTFLHDGSLYRVDSLNEWEKAILYDDPYFNFLKIDRSEVPFEIPTTIDFLERK